MIQPPIFREDRPEVLHALMRDYPLATLVSQFGGTFDADHVPMVLYEDSDGLTLRGHIHAANPIARAGCQALDVMCLFQGPQTYVSPSWYASKAEHGRAVPTWNYVAVHAHGCLRVVQDGDWLMRHLRDLTNQHESHRPEPWAVEDAPADYMARLLRGIVGIEVSVTTLSGVWKVSQNKSAADRDGVRRGLAAESGAETGVMAALVASHASEN